MRYFVTGGTGFIGREVARQLVNDGHEVVALVRDPARAANLAGPGVTLAQGDVAERETMRAPMTGVDGVFHIAGWYRVGVRDKRPGARINIEGTRNVLELMGELGIARGIYTSTVAVFGDTHGAIVDESYRYNGPHLTEYDRTKWVAHYEVAEPLMQAGLPLVIVLPGVTYGPGDTSPMGDALRDYLRGRLPMVPRSTVYCWGHVEDIARGHLLAMARGRPGESYIIAGPPHTLIEALETAQAITGIPAPGLQLDPQVLSIMAGIVGVIERIVPVNPTYAAESLRDGAGVTYLASNSKARRELGYTVRSLEEGFRQTLPAMMAELGIA